MRSLKITRQQKKINNERATKTGKMMSVRGSGYKLKNENKNRKSKTKKDNGNLLLCKCFMDHCGVHRKSLLCPKIDDIQSDVRVWVRANPFHIYKNQRKTLCRNCLVFKLYKIVMLSLLNPVYEQCVILNYCINIGILVNYNRPCLLTNISTYFLPYVTIKLTKSMAYGTRRFIAAFTRALL